MKKAILVLLLSAVSTKDIESNGRDPAQILNKGKQIIAEKQIILPNNNGRNDTKNSQVIKKKLQQNIVPNLDLEGAFKKYLELELDEENIVFLENSTYEFENYLNLLTVETIFDHNM